MLPQHGYKYVTKNLPLVTVAETNTSAFDKILKPYSYNCFAIEVQGGFLPGGSGNLISRLLV